jgi:hypothetical protein
MIYWLLQDTTSQGEFIRLCSFIHIDGKHFDAIHFIDVVYLYPINGMSIYA